MMMMMPREPEQLFPCSHCGRTFAAARLAVHQRICQNFRTEDMGCREQPRASHTPSKVPECGCCHAADISRDGSAKKKKCPSPECAPVHFANRPCKNISSLATSSGAKASKIAATLCGATPRGTPSPAAARHRQDHGTLSQRRRTVRDGFVKVAVPLLLARETIGQASPVNLHDL